MLLTRRRLHQAWYVPILALAMGLMFLRILVMAWMLDVDEFAVFSALLLSSNMAGMLGGFGLYARFQRDMPVLLVQGRHYAASAAFGQAMLGALGVTVLTLILIAAGIRVGGLTAWALVLSVVHALAQQVFLTVTTDSRSRGDAVLFAWENLWRAALTIGAIVAAAATFRTAHATLLAELVVTLLVCAVIYRRVLRDLGTTGLQLLALSVSRAARLNPISLTAFTLIGIAVFASSNADRWIAAQFLDSAAFASYAFGWTIMLVALSVQSIINAPVYPLIARRFAQSGRLGAFRVSAMAGGALLAATGILLLPSIPVASYAISAFFPKYSAATHLVPILGLAAVFRVSDFWSGYVVIVGWELQALIINSMSVAMTVFSWFLLVWAGTLTITPATVAYLCLAVAGITYLASFCTAVATLFTGRSGSRPLRTAGI